MILATETMGNANHPLELFQRVIAVSLETMKIVNGLPRFEINRSWSYGRVDPLTEQPPR